jgi:hypothetical protein
LVGKKAEEVYRYKYFDELKDKLGEMKRKCEGLESSMDNGVDQIQMHCNKMKNEVQLRAEILIEQVHQITESMIAEINQYEKECVDSFKSKIDEYRNDYGKILIEMNELYNISASYINEFKIDETIVEKSLSCVTELTRKLKTEEYNLKKIKFNNRIIHFTSSAFEFEEKLIGSLGNKNLMFEELHFNKYKTNENLYLFEHDDHGHKAIFFIDHAENLKIDLLDSKGKLVKNVADVSKTTTGLVSKSSKNYILNTVLENDSHSVFGNTIIRQEYDEELLILMDKDFKYLKHKVIDYMVSIMDCNDSIVICVEYGNELFRIYDMSLKLVAMQSFSKYGITSVSNIMNMKLNENNWFILYRNNGSGRLLIIDLKKFDLVKEIEVAAYQMKLVLTTHLLLFNPGVNMLFLHNQSGDFEELGKFQLDDSPLGMNEDASTTISFYNSSRVKSISFGHLFNIESI